MRGFGVEDDKITRPADNLCREQELRSLMVRLNRRVTSQGVKRKDKRRLLDG